jgi:tetratricopeptide (TPR) repeat protein
MAVEEKFRRLTVFSLATLIISVSAGIAEASSTADSLLPLDPFASYRFLTEYEPSNHPGIAQTLLALGEIEKAIPHLKSAGDWFGLGRAYFLKGDRETAYKMFSQLETAEAHLLAGVCVEETDPQLALSHFVKAKERLSTIDSYVSLKITGALIELGRAREALPTLTHAIERHPELRRREEVMQILSRIYVMMGYPMLARSQLMRLLSQDYPRHGYSIALLEEEMGWIPEERFRKILWEHPKTVWAAQSFDHLAQIGNLHVHDYLYGGMAYSSLKEYEKAAQYLSRYLQHLPEDERASFELGVVYYRLARYDHAYELLSQVTGELEEDAIFYCARCKERLGANDEALSEYRKIARTSPNFPRARYYAGRLHEETGRFNEAIEVYRTIDRGSPSGPFADHARFRIGFLLNLIGKRREAAREFRQFTERYPESSFLEAALYWTAKATDDDEERHRAVAKLVRTDPLGYYTRLASNRFDVDMPELRRYEGALPTDSESEPSVRKGLLFLKLGLVSEARRELSEAGPEQNHRLSLIYHRYGFTPDAIRYAYRAAQDLLKVLYPRTHILTLQDMSQDPFLMLALVREESRFDPFAISRSGAIGLAQIMPATGAMIAEELGYQDFHTQNLFDVETNLKFGSFYLKKMITRFGNPEYALAAYNAGPHRVTEWLSRLDHNSLDEFVENIPFSETRKYVKRVLATYWSYSRIYSPPYGRPADRDRR